MKMYKDLPKGITLTKKEDYFGAIVAPQLPQYCTPIMVEGV